MRCHVYACDADGRETAIKTSHLSYYEGLAGRDEQILRNQGLLGVAVSVDVLRQNVERMVYSFERYFVTDDVDNILREPTILSRRCNFFDDFVYLPGTFTESGSVKELVQVTVIGSDSLDKMENAARRALVYEVLSRRATHGTNYQLDITENSVTMRAIPVVLDQRF